VAALEAAVMMMTGKPFHVARMPGSYTFAVGLGEGEAAAPALILNLVMKQAQPIDYQRVAYGLSAWNSETQHHLFYFRHLVDDSLPLDVRWLNGYRLLEWHFVRDRAGLSRSPACVHSSHDSTRNCCPSRGPARARSDCLKKHERLPLTLVWMTAPKRNESGT
jgi:hypothetical protein